MTKKNRTKDGVEMAERSEEERKEIFSLAEEK
jgi:hypothetical protein